MGSNIDQGISLLSAVTESNDLAVTNIQNSKVSKDVMDIFTAWANGVNIPLDSSEIDVYLGSYSKGAESYYLFDVSGDEPDPYRGFVVIQNGKLLGSSLSVED